MNKEIKKRLEEIEYWLRILKEDVDSEYYGEIPDDIENFEAAMRRLRWWIQK